MLFKLSVLLVALAPTLLVASPLPNRVDGVTAVVDNVANNLHADAVSSRAFDGKAKANDGGPSGTGVPEKVNMDGFDEVVPASVQDIFVLAKHPQGP